MVVSRGVTKPAQSRLQAKKPAKKSLPHKIGLQLKSLWQESLSLPEGDSLKHVVRTQTCPTLPTNYLQAQVGYALACPRLLPQAVKKLSHKY